MELLIMIAQCISLGGAFIMIAFGVLGLVIIKEKSAKIFFSCVLALAIAISIALLFNW